MTKKTNNNKEDIKPMMTSFAASPYTTTNQSTRSRRNVGGNIERTNRFENIDNGLIPYKYSKGVHNKSSLDVRDVVVLCQKAYYNFSVFRNVIDLMTEFSATKVYFTGGSKKSRDFLEALYRKIDLQSFLDKFFREYYRSGNVFVHRFDTKIQPEDLKRITQTYGNSSLSAEEEGTLPSRYIVLNPADIQMGGNISFFSGIYYKILSDYELERLKNPKTEEDQEVYDALDAETKKALKGRNVGVLSIKLDPEKVTPVFYKKQDYEPFAVPMGYPVLEDINWKTEMKKMDMALTRTTNQAILLITMGAELKDGSLNVNQRSIETMQKLFENQSVGKVLVSDYTTQAKFVIPDIAGILDPRKYQVVNNDIQMGLNNILVGEEKFANTSIKIQVFIERLKQGREAFLNQFLCPEIKRVCKSLGFKNYPQAHFEEIELKDKTTWNRVVAQLLQYGVLTAEEGLEAMSSGRLPEPEESLESQKKFKGLKDQGLYSPLVGGSQQAEQSEDKDKEKDKKLPQPEGRPDGETSPQTTKKVSPIGDNTSGKEKFSVEKIKENLVLAEKLESEIQEQLKLKYENKRVTNKIRALSEEISKVVMANEEPDKWLEKCKEYIANPIDANHNRVSEVEAIACEHQVDDYLASLLRASKI
tara:strand:+ start:8863 stop:10797 length:1935 start_codon:yes stop_codon:yes gene_type:complete